MENIHHEIREQERFEEEHPLHHALKSNRHLNKKLLEAHVGDFFKKFR